MKTAKFYSYLFYFSMILIVEILFLVLNNIFVEQIISIRFSILVISEGNDRVVFPMADSSWFLIS